MNPGAQSLTCLFRDINFGHSFSRFRNVLTCMSRIFNLKVIRDPNSGSVRQNVMLRDHVYRAQDSKHKHVGLFENSVPENRDVELQYIAVDPFLFYPPRNHHIVDSFNRSIPSMVGNPSIHHIFRSLSQ